MFKRILEKIADNFLNLGVSVSESNDADHASIVSGEIAFDLGEKVLKTALVPFGFGLLVSAAADHIITGGRITNMILPNSEAPDDIYDFNNYDLDMSTTATDYLKQVAKKEMQKCNVTGYSKSGIAGVIGTATSDAVVPVKQNKEISERIKRLMLTVDSQNLVFIPVYSAGKNSVAVIEAEIQQEAVQQAGKALDNKNTLLVSSTAIIVDKTACQALYDSYNSQTAENYTVSTHFSNMHNQIENSRNKGQLYLAVVNIPETNKPNELIDNLLESQDDVYIDMTQVIGLVDIPNVRESFIKGKSDFWQYLNNSRFMVCPQGLPKATINYYRDNLGMFSLKAATAKNVEDTPFADLKIVTLGDQRLLGMQ